MQGSGVGNAHSVRSGVGNAQNARNMYIMYRVQKTGVCNAQDVGVRLPCC